MKPRYEAAERTATEYVTLDGALCVAETKNAIKVKLSNGRYIWVPQSLIHADSEVWGKSEERRGPGRLVLPLWLVERERLLA